jgi:hypothetical protein
MKSTEVSIWPASTCSTTSMSTAPLSSTSTCSSRSAPEFWNGSTRLKSKLVKSRGPGQVHSRPTPRRSQTSCDQAASFDLQYSNLWCSSQAGFLITESTNRRIKVDGGKRESARVQLFKDAPKIAKQFVLQVLLKLVWNGRNLWL